MVTESVGFSAIQPHVKSLNQPLQTCSLPSCSSPRAVVGWLGAGVFLTLMSDRNLNERGREPYHRTYPRHPHATRAVTTAQRHLARELVQVYPVACASGRRRVREKDCVHLTGGTAGSFVDELFSARHERTTGNRLTRCAQPGKESHHDSARACPPARYRTVQTSINSDGKLKNSARASSRARLTQSPR